MYLCKTALPSRGPYARDTMAHASTVKDCRLRQQEFTPTQKKIPPISRYKSALPSFGPPAFNDGTRKQGCDGLSHIDERTFATLYSE